MRAGSLRHLVALQSKVVARNPQTNQVTSSSWQTVGKVWAGIEPLSAREFVQTSALQSEVTVRITIRYRQGVRADMRIAYKGQIYNIAGVLPDKVSGLDYLTLPCSEGINEG